MPQERKQEPGRRHRAERLHRPREKRHGTGILETRIARERAEAVLGEPEVVVGRGMLRVNQDRAEEQQTARPETTVALFEEQVRLIGICIVDVEGDEENLADEMSVWRSVSAGVKGMMGRRQQRERSAVAVSRFETDVQREFARALSGR